MNEQARGILTRKRKEKEAPSEPPPASNRLLAGYMAHEFLAKGTLFGRKFEPEPEAETSETRKPPSYFEVANLVKSEQLHVPGVVNPAELARWIQS